MGLVIDGGKSLKVQVGVDLGSGNLGMAQQLLNRPKVPTTLQEMAGKGVPEHVWVNLHTEAGCAGLFGELALNRPAGESLTALVHEECRLIRMLGPAG